MNEVKPSELISKPVMKAGIVFGGVSAVIALLGIIPIVNIFLSLIGWVVALVGGYVVVTVAGTTKDKLPEVLKHTVIAGVIAGLISAIGASIASVVNGLFISRVSFLGIYYTPGLAEIIGWVISAFIFGVIGMVIWYVIGGIIQVYYTPDKLPAGLKMQLDKVIAFIKK